LHLNVIMSYAVLPYYFTEVKKVCSRLYLFPLNVFADLDTVLKNIFKVQTNSSTIKVSFTRC